MKRCIIIRFLDNSDKINYTSPALSEDPPRGCAVNTVSLKLSS